MNIDKTAFNRRNTTIDILRALTMLLMIFVNDLWTIKDYPLWLGHAQFDQDMLGLSDIVFPCFLFVVGMSIPYAIERRFSKGLSGVSTVAHILTRTLALLLMGVFTVNTESGISETTGMSLGLYRILMVTAFLLIWNVYPRTDKLSVKRLYTALKFTGLLLLVWLAVIFRDADGGVFSSHWWGILGLIGWTYLVCAFIYLFTRDNLKYLIPIWLIIILICIFKSNTQAGEPILNLPEGNFLDEMLSILHIGNGSLPAFTMGGIIFSLIGVKYHNIDNRKKIAGAATAVIILLIIGTITHQIWIVSKLQGTPPWVFYCIAVSIGIYAVIGILTEKGKAGYFDIIKPAGTATLTCYLLPYIAYSLTSILGIELPEWLRTGFPGIINCIVFSFVIIIITGFLERIHIKLKI